MTTCDTHIWQMVTTWVRLEVYNLWETLGSSQCESLIYVLSLLPAIETVKGNSTWFGVK